MSIKSMIGKGLIGFGLGVFFVVGLFLAGIASADPTGALAPDAAAPTVDAGPAVAIDAGMPANVPVLDESPIEFGRFVKALWKSGAIMPALIVAVFAVLIVARKRIAWLNEGKRAAYTAAAFAFLAAIIEPASRGSTPTINMLIGAIGAALALLAKPTTKDDAA